MVDPLHHQAHLTHNHDQMTTTRYRVGVLVPIVLFLIALPLFQKMLGKNITGYLDTGHRDLRGKVGIQGKVEIPVVPIEHITCQWLPGCERFLVAFIHLPGQRGPMLSSID